LKFEVIRVNQEQRNSQDKIDDFFSKNFDEKIWWCVHGRINSEVSQSVEIGPL
jgi:hypothetical protein